MKKLIVSAVKVAKRVNVLLEDLATGVKYAQSR